MNETKLLQTDGGNAAIVIELVVVGLIVIGSMKGCSDADHGK